MKKLLVFMGLASMAAFMSCGNETEKLRNAKDSVENVNAQQKDILYDLTETLVEVSTSLDSIAAGEGLLKRTDEGKALTRQQVIENLNSFKQMLAENREKLSKMEQQLSQRNDQIGKLSALIKHLNNELDEREATIARLEEVIKDQKSTIRDLESAVETSKLALSEMEEQNVQQREQLSQQDASMYAVYFTFGTKKQLKERGLLSGGGLFKKKKADMSNVDKTQFSKADRRLMSEIQLPSGSAKVMSGQPSDSYEIIEKNDDKCVLKITNAARFWNVSDVLIIMLD
jgi:DNA repair exonuclease SbcCD ATPase subunit